MAEGGSGSEAAKEDLDWEEEEMVAWEVKADGRLSQEQQGQEVAKAPVGKRKQVDEDLEALVAPAETAIVAVEDVAVTAVTVIVRVTYAGKAKYAEEVGAGWTEGV